ncbi:MAG: tRNA pseudouridine(13) synthase TruD [Gammaproteobacteria bacterium]|nr:MAG: tRNA pseudouridine(13) synthase TruD [Gammaproteobacteria bacterium]
MNPSYQLDALPHAFPQLLISAEIRTVPEDFIVDEELGFSPTGDGEHVFLHIRKRGRNTEDLARALARQSNVPRKAVSYAGLKDRNAVTSQYFSVHLPGKDDPDWQDMADSSLELLSINRHRKKIRRGGLQNNGFRLLLREFDGNKELAEQRLAQIKSNGVPNYFTAQRFGHDANNLHQADEMLMNGRRTKDRFKRNIYFSAARSWLFNLLLAERIRSNTWNKAIQGDSMMLSGSRSCFHIDTVDDEIRKRIDELDISPTGPLWGSGSSMLTNEAAEVELASLSDWKSWKEGLEKAGQQMARRSLRMPVTDLSWNWPEENQLELKFSLLPGGYATAVLRELGNFTVPQINK